MNETKSKKFKDLIAKLSADPKIKMAIDDFKSKASGDGVYHSKSFVDMLVYILKLSGGFLGKRKAKMVVEIIEALAFIVTISLMLKRNLFDRPEVRAYFLDRWKGIKSQSEKALNLAHGYVNSRIKKVKTKSHPTA